MAFDGILWVMPCVALAVIFILATALSVAAQGAGSFCPKISVVGPAGITLAGDDITFVAEVAGTVLSIRYEWAVEGGTIVVGQGTARIKVSGGSPNSVVKATVKIEGIPGFCQNSASEQAGVAPKFGCGMPLDEWGKLKPNDIRGRLDVFFADISNNPDSTGSITLYTLGSERRDAENSRVKLIVQHSKFRKFDLSRFIFVFEHEPSDEIRTVLHRIPLGAELPCSDCVRINGSDLK